MKLLDIIKEADQKNIAIGHFNFATLDGLWAIFEAARELNQPVIVGTSEGERDFVGVRQAADLVYSLRYQFNYPIFLNADHTHSLDKVKEAVVAGYDAVLFDGSKLSLRENIKKTKAVVAYVKSINPDIVVEGELGFIGGSSKILEVIPEGAAVKKENFTQPKDALKFVRETGVDLLAPAVGNLHGMFADRKNPALDIERISELREAAGTPLVLHGGSGISDDDFKKAISAGVGIIHISTEARLAWRKGLEIALAADEKEVSPYKILAEAKGNMKRVVTDRLRLFGDAKQIW